MRDEVVVMKRLKGQRRGGMEREEEKKILSCLKNQKVGVRPESLAPLPRLERSQFATSPRRLYSRAREQDYQSNSDLHIKRISVALHFQPQRCCDAAIRLAERRQRFIVSVKPQLSTRWAFLFERFLFLCHSSFPLFEITRKKRKEELLII
ncbi:hypothetical protein EYF80_019572 [Liparis tanakae]|uniref:Uncharacterized protein n=1 Tax=Liparis tanakae TaxID=230148 RepID=A0A4Z2HXA5_9TELE|nr:hypothetical protein EYF80_019572 [Liparis tanakae]